MRRIGGWIWTIVWVTAAGAAVNVLLTWAIAAWMPLSWAEPLRNNVGEDWPGPDGSMGYWSHAGGMGIDVYHNWGAKGGEGYFSYFSGQYALVEDVGWPMRGMRSQVTAYHDEQGNLPTRWDLPGHVIVDRGLQTDELPAWMHVQEARRLPLRPHGWGFAANSMLWALLIGGCYGCAKMLNRPAH